MAKPTRDTSEWTDDLSVGVNCIDKDHKKLFSLLNMMKQLVAGGGKDDKKLEHILNELQYYTEYHFKREEILMDVCGYPNLENHRQVHDVMKTLVNTYMNSFQEDKNSIDLDSLCKFMEEWLIDHIAGMDKQYASWMEGKESLIERANAQFEKERKTWDSFGESAQKPKLLVVDDEIAICNAICTFAERVGYEAVYIVHGKDIENLYSNEITVIILDLFLADMDGIEMLRFLADKGCKAAIILISGGDLSVLHSARVLAEERGLNVFETVNKPFTRDEIQNLLARVRVPEIRQDIKEGKAKSTLLLQELRRAISEREIYPYFQPKVRIDTGKVVGFEALARWQHPSKGMISPGEFIPFAEENNLINDLTMLIVDQTFAESASRLYAENNLEISLNISAQLLNDLNFPERLIKKAEDYNIDPSRIILEITESALADEMAKSLDILIRLRMKGFLLSIDDFGTGYSSMLQLHRVPFSELKIDQSFVKNMVTDEDDHAICEGAIDLGHKLGMTVIAEGIETKAMWNSLKKLYCDLGQGYYFGKPMPPVECEAWYKDREG